MKILIVTQYFWPETFKINDLAKGFIERGHEVTVYTGKPNYPQGKIYKGYSFFRPFKEQHPDGYTVFRCPLIPRMQGRSLFLAINYISFVIFGIFFSFLLSRRKFDKIFIYEPSPITVAIPAIFIKFIKRIPIFFWVTDLWPESVEDAGAVKSKRVLGMISAMVRWIYKRCDMILITSPGFKERIEGHRVPSEKIKYFPQWAEDFFYPVKEDPGLAIMKEYNDSFKIMYAGNIGEAQDFDTLLATAESLRHISNIKWIILGDGRMKKYVEQEVRRRNIEDAFILLGRFPMTDMSKFFHYADLMLVSLKRSEIFALTIPSRVQHYLACGKRIVGNIDGEGAKIITESGAGLASNSGDVTALTENILSLYYEDKEVCLQREKSSRDYFESNFEREKLISQLLGWMEEL